MPVRANVAPGETSREEGHLGPDAKHGTQRSERICFGGQTGDHPLADQDVLRTLRPILISGRIFGMPYYPLHEDVKRGRYTPRFYETLTLVSYAVLLLTVGMFAYIIPQLYQYGSRLVKGVEESTSSGINVTVLWFTTTTLGLVPLTSSIVLRARISELIVELRDVHAKLRAVGALEIRRHWFIFRIIVNMIVDNIVTATLMYLAFIYAEEMQLFRQIMNCAFMFYMMSVSMLSRTLLLTILRLISSGFGTISDVLLNAFGDNSHESGTRSRRRRPDELVPSKRETYHRRRRKKLPRSPKIFDESDTARLRQLASLHLKLGHICVKFMSVFGPHLLSLFLATIVCSLCYCYFFLQWAMGTLAMEYVTAHVIFFVFMQIKFFFISMAIAWLCGDVSRKAESMGRVVSSIMIKMDEAPIKDELRTFASQLLHSTVDFECCGLVKIRPSIMTSMTATIVTHLVIIIQFQLSALQTEISDEEIPHEVLMGTPSSYNLTSSDM